MQQVYTKIYFFIVMTYIWLLYQYDIIKKTSFVLVAVALTFMRYTFRACLTVALSQEGHLYALNECSSRDDGKLSIYKGMFIQSVVTPLTIHKH